MVIRTFPIASMIVCASLSMAGVAMAQQSGQSGSGQQGQYQGVSTPPGDAITTTDDTPQPLPKPSPAKPVTLAPAPEPPPQPAATDYQPAQPMPDQPTVTTRTAYSDPDGDIVHPLAAPPGEILEGATIRVRLIDRISSTESQRNQPFRGKVATDVLEGGKVLIPAGSEIEGRIATVSSGDHLGGHGSFRLQPEAVVLPDGTRYQLRAEVTGTPGSKTRVGSEGTINAGSRAKKDGIEYGAVVGTGAVTGAVVGGPVGALVGSGIGAGVVTTHLLVDHPQATLEPGAVVLFTLTQPLNLMPQTAQQ
ncbi:hypothetical protein ACFPT7_13210 [Acidicapsa dinghuensis]|uniref:TrbI/VirB10 family protein n=1 Tax=Acidicapsa dinghuensis TaxID=2218256 RepID=A0ABW1EFZ9_9BACT|nr:hypothetical protein [Acidicapsa dinghuensis]